jgi:glutathione S-transferase
MGQPVVHGPSFSTYVRSVRLALHEKGVEHKLVEVDLLGGQTFFGGATVRLADVHTQPVLVYLRATPEGKAMLDSAPKLSSWMGRMLERASVRAMMPS